MREHARFRVDPSRVRVAIRPISSPTKCYRVTISERKPDGIEAYATHASAGVALDLALGIAEEAHMPGIDLGMEWAYPHPFFGADFT